MCPLRRLFFKNSSLKILKSDFAAEYSVVYSYVRGFDSIFFVTKSKKAGIYCFHFHIIGVFIFDFPGQRAEPRSTFSSRTVGINFYFNHNSSPPFRLLILIANSVSIVVIIRLDRIIQSFFLDCLSSASRPRTQAGSLRRTRRPIKLGDDRTKTQMFLFCYLLLAPGYVPFFVTGQHSGPGNDSR
jgi:hypothetical protein